MMFDKVITKSIRLIVLLAAVIAFQEVFAEPFRVQGFVAGPDFDLDKVPVSELSDLALEKRIPC